MAEQDHDRSEAATPYKLQKARERGQVPKSAEVASALVFTAAMVFLSWRGAAAWREELRIARALLARAGRAAGPAVLWPLLADALEATLRLAAPFLLTLLVAAVVGNLVQTGPLLSLRPLEPDWDRVNPAAGLKRLFTVRTLFVGGRALLKLALLTWVAYLAVRSLVPHFYLYSTLPPHALVQFLLADAASLGLRIALVLALVALLDLAFTRRQFARQMRMSRRDLKDEIKQREGDPRIRARLRELRREVLKRVLALRKTREADVVLTNPTHVAVALRYVHGQMDAPRLVAKGSGVLAAVMREIAARHRIPVVPSPTLARALFHDLPVDASVPPELYGQVARILVWVLAMRGPGRGQAGAAPARGAA